MSSWSRLRIVVVVVTCAVIGVGLVAAREWGEHADSFVATPDPPATEARLDALRRAGFGVWWLGPRWQRERGAPAKALRRVR